MAASSPTPKHPAAPKAEKPVTSRSKPASKPAVVFTDWASI